MNTQQAGLNLGGLTPKFILLDAILFCPYINERINS